VRWVAGDLLNVNPLNLFETEDRGQRYLNSELGMRNAERKKDDRVLNSELGMRNAERKKEDRRQMTEDRFNCPDLYLS
jgi:hypothetical protein